MGLTIARFLSLLLDCRFTLSSLKQRKLPVTVRLSAVEIGISAVQI